MAEAEDTAGSVVGDWRSLFSSPRGLYSALLPEYSAPFSPLRSLSSQDFPSLSEGKSWEGGALGGGSGWRGSQQQSGRSGGSFVERKAARCGFSAPRINTVRFRSVSPLASPGVRSPYITIPPGLSPTTLLDSPVMLHSSQGQLSPTTGTFPLPPYDQGHPVAMPVGSNKEKHKAADTDDSPFVFKPHSDFNSLPVLSSKQNQTFPTSGGAQLRTMEDANNQSGTHAKPPLAVDCCTGLIEEGSSNNFNTERCVVISSDGCTANAKYMESLSCPPGVSDQTQTQNVDPLNAGEDTSSQQNGEEDQKEGLSSMGLGRPSEDGYSWRKYGQKQVKGSEYPRSYYKCTHQNCSVKKKVERSLDGQITEIIYKGAHNHAKPQLNRRTSPGSIFSVGLSEYAREENGSVWKGLQPENKDHRSNGDWKGDGMERSTSALTELSEPLSTAHGKHLGVLESADTPELSSTLASHDVDEDEATQRSPSHGDDDDESELKRRKKESCFMEANLAARAIREPRVVVQTDSEVDILDDGYRWRKYGQKVVKGNPNPRSYYKCTSAGCSVRKHVERASHDLKFVITTYEGKHNHEVPVARSSNHLNNGNGNDRPSSSTQSFPPLSGSDNIPKPEQFQGIAPQFERKPELSSNFLKHGCLSSYSGDRNFGSMYYDMKLPPSLHTSIPFGSFGHSRALHPPSFTHVIPDHPLSSSNLEMRPPASLSLAGFECNLSKPMDMYQPLLLQHAKEVDLRFLAPKQEKDDGAYETQLPSSHAGNAPYSQIMGRYPQ